MEDSRMSKIGKWYKGLTKTGKVATVSTALLLSFGTIGTLAQPGNTTQQQDQGSGKAESVAKPKVATKSVVTTEPIPFTSSTVEDPNLNQGVTQTRTAGVNGVLTRTYQVTYTNGVETGRSAPVDTVTTPAIVEVIAKGTKAPAPTCPNGTYVNTAGNTVCRPYESSSAPSGATARCSDGTYSFSQSRRGTCSHHGGVAEWL